VARFSASLYPPRMALFELAMPLDDPVIKQAIDDLANALQTAVLVSERLHVALSNRTEDTAALQHALKRAAVTLRRLQPR
jgi:hypothetical protein